MIGVKTKRVKLVTALAAMSLGGGLEFGWNEFQTPAPVPARSIFAPDKPKTTESKKVITKKPLVVKVPLPKEVRTEMTTALDAFPPKSVKLNLSGVVPPHGKACLVRGLQVYVNLPPDPGPADLSDESVYWVGAVEFGHAKDLDEPQGFNLDLAKPLAAQKRDKQWDPTKPLKITLIAITIDPGAELPNDLSISVKTVSVSVSGKDQKR